MWLWHDVAEVAGRSQADILLFLASLIIFVKGSEGDGSEEITDISFHAENMIAGRRVTCDPFVPKTSYPAKTWTCKNMKIDGERLRYWVAPGFYDGYYHCGVKMDKWRGRNNFGALCYTLLKKHNVDEKLWAATISEASCNHSRQDRALFVKNKTNDAAHSENGYKWEKFDAGRGYVVTFQCMILP